MKYSDEYLNVMYGINYETATDEELAQQTELLEKASSDFVAKATKPLLIITVVDIVLRLICALTADRLYYTKLINDLKLIDESVKEPNMRKLLIARKGGLSPLAFAASLAGHNLLVQLLVSGADMIMNSF
jgi:hypothetical protein